jgi:hypothetical protein
VIGPIPMLGFGAEYLFSSAFHLYPNGK